MDLYLFMSDHLGISFLEVFNLRLFECIHFLDSVIQYTNKRSYIFSGGACMLEKATRFEHQASTSFVVSQEKWMDYVSMIQKANSLKKQLRVTVFVGGYQRTVIGYCVLFNEFLRTFICGDIVVRADEILKVEYLEGRERHVTS
jgi:hypothetical protein